MRVVQFHFQSSEVSGIVRIDQIGFCSGNYMAISEKEKTKIVQLIRAIVPGVTVILFGSQARDTAKLGSDIDLALDAGRALSALEYTEITGVLDGTNLPYTFDIVDLYKASAAIKKSIEEEGVRWTM
jgi:uncharacterized protein